MLSSFLSDHHSVNLIQFLTVWESVLVSELPGGRDGTGTAPKQKPQLHQVPAQLKNRREATAASEVHDERCKSLLPHKPFTTNEVESR